MLVIVDNDRLYTWAVEVNVCRRDKLKISGNSFPIWRDSNPLPYHWAVANTLEHLCYFISHLSTSLTHLMFENCSNFQCFCEGDIRSTFIWTGQVSCEHFSEKYKVVNLFVEINWHLLLMSSILIKIMSTLW